MQLIFLGTAPALASATQDHIYLLVDGPAGFWLVDCGGSAAHQMLKLGYDPLQLSGMFLTHGHADHIYGLPVFIQDMWLRGRQLPLPIYANAPTIERCRQILNVFMGEAMYSFVEFRLIAETPQNLVCESADFMLRASPTVHSFPCHALRFEAKTSGRTLVYSADTAPCTNVSELARGAQVLLHEATVLETTSLAVGHATAAEAVGIATEAGIEELWLVHTNPALHEVGNPHLAGARQSFKGKLIVAQDGDRITF